MLKIIFFLILDNLYGEYSKLRDEEKNMRVRENPHDLIDLLPPIERKAFDIISSRSSSGGVTQTELWSLLGIDSKEGSRIVLRLLRRGLIMRKEAELNGRKAYILLLPGHIIFREDLPEKVNMDSMREIPCFTCNIIFQCMNSADENWSRCDKLSRYISRKK
ncbi:MAG: hypothetical protein QW366_01420 [Sulfolobales archaeon]